MLHKQIEAMYVDLDSLYNPFSVNLSTFSNAVDHFHLPEYFKSVTAAF